MRILRNVIVCLVAIRLLLIVLTQLGVVNKDSFEYRSGQQEATNVMAQIKSAVVTAPPAKAPEPVPAAEPAPAPVAVAAVTPTPAPAWTRPAVIPAIPGGTLTTPDAIYSGARIVQVDADRVTIAHDGGRVVIPMWQLPAALQHQLNYDPKAAETATAQRQSTDAPVELAVARPDAPSAPPAQAFSETTDYATGLASAKASGRKVLLHFTGSDWCGYCKLMEKEVLSTSTFNQFAASNYVIVTLDFPHDIPLPANLKDQNDRLAQKYHVDGYPTLVVITPDERELGRLSGYNPGSGPDEVISRLRSYGGK